ncbi:hypothetical protein CVT26_006066, partial [Gymnopilus dilepis]
NGSASCIVTGPKGRAVPRVQSHPIAYPLPAGDPDAAETWAGLEVKLADFGVGTYTSGSGSFSSRLIAQLVMNVLWMINIHLTYLEAYHVKGDPRVVSTDIVTTPSMRAPEVCIGAGWGAGVDIWSLGCTIVQLFTGQSLFKPEIMPESLPYVHTGVFGDYPLEMIKRGKYSKQYFEEDDPEKRATCKQLLEHEWLNT